MPGGVFMLGQKRNDSLFGPGSRTIEAPQSVLEKQEGCVGGISSG